MRLKTIGVAIEFLGSSARPLSAGVATEAARGRGSLTVVSYAAVGRSEEIVRRSTLLARWDSPLSEPVQDHQAEQRRIPGGDLRLKGDVQLLAEVCCAHAAIGR